MGPYLAEMSVARRQEECEGEEEEEEEESVEAPTIVAQKNDISGPPIIVMPEPEVPEELVSKMAELVDGGHSKTLTVRENQEGVLLDATVSKINYCVQSDRSGFSSFFCEPDREVVRGIKKAQDDMQTLVEAAKLQRNNAIPQCSPAEVDESSSPKNAREDTSTGKHMEKATSQEKHQLGAIGLQLVLDSAGVVRDFARRARRLAADADNKRGSSCCRNRGLCGTYDGGCELGGDVEPFVRNVFFPVDVFSGGEARQTPKKDADHAEKGRRDVVPAARPRLRAKSKMRNRIVEGMSFSRAQGSLLARSSVAPAEAQNTQPNALKKTVLIEQYKECAGRMLNRSKYERAAVRRTGWEETGSSAEKRGPNSRP